MLKEIRASLLLPDVLFNVDQHTSHWIAPNPDRFPYRKNPLLTKRVSSRL